MPCTKFLPAFGSPVGVPVTTAGDGAYSRTPAYGSSSSSRDIHDPCSASSARLASSSSAICRSSDRSPVIQNERPFVAATNSSSSTARSVTGTTGMLARSGIHDAPSSSET